MKKPQQPPSAVSSVRSLPSCYGSVSIDSVSSPSIAPGSAHQPLDSAPPNPSRSAGNLNIIVMGDIGVGKSELVKKYAYGTTHFRFSPGDRISGSKAIKLNSGDAYMLSINDTFSVHLDTPIAVHQIKQADGVMLVYAVDSRDSVGTVLNIYNFIANHFKDPKGRKTIPLCIVANKADLNSREVDLVITQKGVTFAKDHNCLFFETSVVNEQGIDEAFRGLAENIVASRSEKKELDDVFSKLKRKLQGK